jgi:hypothetical protein
MFLRTSFEAVQHSIAGRLEDPLPCWMDTQMLSMLSRELTRCSQQSKPLFSPTVTEQLYIASQQCELLLKQCPGVMSSAVCHRQLAAIMLSRELTRCSQQSKPLFPPTVTEQLYIASQQCELLLKQCPGVMSSAVCHRQLAAIMLSLSSSLKHIDTPFKRRWLWTKRN